MPFISDLLRQQAIEQSRNKHVQEVYMERTGNALIQQLAQSEARRELAKRQAMGSTLEQAAARDLKREMGYEQIDLNRQVRKDQATMQFLSGAINAVSAFAAHQFMSETSDDPLGIEVKGDLIFTDQELDAAAEFYEEGGEFYEMMDEQGTPVLGTDPLRPMGDFNFGFA